MQNKKLQSETEYPNVGGTNYAYMVRCVDGSLYSGWTNDIEKRLLAHNSGRGAKYTRSRLPVTLAYLEEFPTKEEAMSREWHLKELTKKEKEELAEGWAKNHELYENH